MTKEEIEKRFELVEVPTQTAILFKDANTNKTFDLNEALVQILNDLNDLKKRI